MNDRWRRLAPISYWAKEGARIERPMRTSTKVGLYALAIIVLAVGLHLLPGAAVVQPATAEAQTSGCMAPAGSPCPSDYNQTGPANYNLPGPADYNVNCATNGWCVQGAVMPATTTADPWCVWTQQYCYDVGGQSPAGTSGGAPAYFWESYPSYNFAIAAGLNNQACYRTAYKHGTTNGSLSGDQFWTKMSFDWCVNRHSGAFKQFSIGPATWWGVTTVGTFNGWVEGGSDGRVLVGGGGPKVVNRNGCSGCLIVWRKFRFRHCNVFSTNAPDCSWSTYDQGLKFIVKPGFPPAGVTIRWWKA